MLVLDLNKKEFDGFSLADIHLSFPNSGMFVLKGPNGCGKSTLLNILSGRDSDFAGSLAYDGKPADWRFKEKYACLVPQTPIIFNELSVIDNVMAPYRHKDKKKALSALEAVGLVNATSTPVMALSSGEKLRLGLARAIYGDYPIYLVDEIDAFLDEETSEEIYAILKDLSKTCLVVTASHRGVSIDPSHEVIVGSCLRFVGPGEDSKADETKRDQAKGKSVLDWRFDSIAAVFCLLFGFLGLFLGSSTGLVDYGYLDLFTSSQPGISLSQQRMFAESEGLLLDPESPRFEQGCSVISTEFVFDGNATVSWLFALDGDCDDIDSLKPENLLAGDWPSDGSECLLPSNYFDSKGLAYSSFAEAKIDFDGISLSCCGVYQSRNGSFYSTAYGRMLDSRSFNWNFIASEIGFLSNSAFTFNGDDFPIDYVMAMGWRGLNLSKADLNGSALFSDDPCILMTSSGSTPLRWIESYPASNSCFSFVFAIGSGALMCILCFAYYQRNKRRALLLLASGKTRKSLLKESFADFLGSSLAALAGSLVVYFAVWLPYLLSLSVSFPGLFFFHFPLEAFMVELLSIFIVDVVFAVLAFRLLAPKDISAKLNDLKRG